MSYFYQRPTQNLYDTEEYDYNDPRLHTNFLSFFSNLGDTLKSGFEDVGHGIVDVGKKAVETLTGGLIGGSPSAPPAPPAAAPPDAAPVPQTPGLYNTQFGDCKLLVRAPEQGGGSFWLCPQGSALPTQYMQVGKCAPTTSNNINYTTCRTVF
jgi:hypothetical protein